MNNLVNKQTTVKKIVQVKATVANESLTKFLPLKRTMMALHFVMTMKLIRNVPSTMAPVKTLFLRCVDEKIGLLSS